MPIKNINSFLNTGTIELTGSNGLLGIVNGELKRLNNTSLSITPSGLNLNSGTYRINNIPANNFILTFGHTLTNMGTGDYYFSNLYNLSASTNQIQRRTRVMQNCQARFASWNAYAQTLGQSNDFSCSGYFVNYTTLTSGLISNQIRPINTASLFTYGGTITPSINVNSGDDVQITLKVPAVSQQIVGGHNFVDVYLFG